MHSIATELEWLRWFRQEALRDCLADDLVKERVEEWLRNEFEVRTKLICPERLIKASAPLPTPTHPHASIPMQ